MIKHLLPAIMMTVLMTALTGLAYPLAMTGLAQRLFPHQAKGSLIERDGAVIGSELIGQNFTADGYFHGRPSATTDADPNDSTKTVPAPYNAGNSGGSNLGPTSKALVDRVREDSQTLAGQNSASPVPVDLVTTSASGLDPDITPAAALFQVPRVAKARKLSEDQLRALVNNNTASRLFGVLGEPRVNVLKLNLALDKAFPKQESREGEANPSVAEAISGPSTSNAAPPLAVEAAPTTIEAPASPAVAPSVAAASDATAPAASAVETPAPAIGAPPAGRLQASGSKSGPVFPSEISPSHADEKPSLARLKTCSDQFHANAATDSNGGLKWTDYWKECKKRLAS